MLWVKNTHTFIGPRQRYVWFFLTSTVYFNVQENCLKDLRIAKIGCFKWFISSNWFSLYCLIYYIFRSPKTKPNTNAKCPNGGKISECWNWDKFSSSARTVMVPNGVQHIYILIGQLQGSVIQLPCTKPVTSKSLFSSIHFWLSSLFDWSIDKFLKILSLA
jgi:hypothetical protein